MSHSCPNLVSTSFLYNPYIPFFNLNIYICYAQSTDSDHPRILLRKPRIRALRNNPRIVHANLGSARNHLGSRNQTSAIRGNKPTIDRARKAARPSAATWVHCSRWPSCFACALPPVESRGQQRAWDSGPLETLKNQLYNSSNDPVAKARLLSVSTKEAGAWLNVLPAPHLGTKLDDTTVRIAIGLRLGANIVEEHRCICGAPVHRNGTHGLSCHKSGGRIPRHQAANETLCRALVSGGVPSILEPVGVCREDAKRPDGMTHSVGGWSFPFMGFHVLRHPCTIP